MQQQQDKIYKIVRGKKYKIVRNSGIKVISDRDICAIHRVHFAFCKSDLLLTLSIDSCIQNKKKKDIVAAVIVSGRHDPCAV